jgi:hypothetical protein
VVPFGSCARRPDLEVGLVAVYLESGIGHPTEIAAFCLEGAEQGNDQAQHFLGYMFLGAGRCLPIDQTCIGDVFLGPW